MSEIIFENGSYIYVLPITRGQTKGTIKIAKENQLIEPYSNEYYNALLNIFENMEKVDNGNNYTKY